MQEQPSAGPVRFVRNRLSSNPGMIRFTPNPGPVSRTSEAVSNANLPRAFGATRRQSKRAHLRAIVPTAYSQN